MPRTEKANQLIREETTDRILGAARRVFARKGSAGTMAEVAMEAGVSQGLAYRYFPSKEAIFNSLLKELTVPPDELDACVQRVPGTAAERLNHIISTMMERRQEIPEFYQFMNQVMRDEKLPKELREAQQRQGLLFREILRRLIVEGQAAGDIAKDDPDQLLGVIMACLDGLSRSLVAQLPGEAPRMFPRAKIVLRMLRPDRVTHF